jgi:hypothetical protein
LERWRGSQVDHEGCRVEATRAAESSTHVKGLFYCERMASAGGRAGGLWCGIAGERAVRRGGEGERDHVKNE